MRGPAQTCLVPTSKPLLPKPPLPLSRPPLLTKASAPRRSLTTLSVANFSVGSYFHFVCNAGGRGWRHRFNTAFTHATAVVLKKKGRIQQTTRFTQGASPAVPLAPKTRADGGRLDAERHIGTRRGKFRMCPQDLNATCDYCCNV